MKDCTLFQLQQIFEPKDTNCTFFYKMQVPDGCKMMTIDFEYSPKRLEDKAVAEEVIASSIRKYMPAPYDKELSGYRLENVPVVNLLTVSLDDCAGNYIGCAHRHTNVQHHEITPTSASPGFCPAEMQPGIWRIGLQCHAIVTSFVHVDLCVKGVYSDEVDSD